MSTMRVVAALLALGVAAHAWADDPRPTGSWPETLDAAVSAVLAKLNRNQKAIIRSASKDDLLVALPDWGEDVQELLSLRRGNDKLIEAVCKAPCPPDRATEIIMEAAWESLRK
jgi:hypothetical protein